MNVFNTAATFFLLPNFEGIIGVTYLLKQNDVVLDLKHLLTAYCSKVIQLFKCPDINFINAEGIMVSLDSKEFKLNLI